MAVCGPSHGRLPLYAGVKGKPVDPVCRDKASQGSRPVLGLRHATVGKRTLAYFTGLLVCRSTIRPLSST